MYNASWTLGNICHALQNVPFSKIEQALTAWRFMRIESDWFHIEPFDNLTDRLI